MSELFSKYFFNFDSAMSDEWTDYDRFWTTACFILGFFGFIIALIVR